MLLLQCRNRISFPKLHNLVPDGKMKIFLVFLGLLGNSAAMPMPMPRMPGFSSKSEEMMRYGQFNFMSPPYMPPMMPYGNGLPFPQQFPQFQMPMWPQPPPSGWQNPPTPKHQGKDDQTPDTPKSNQTQTNNATQKQPSTSPPHEPTQGKQETPPPQPFPFGNGLFPFQQPPWPIPQRVPPPGFGRPPLSSEDGGGNPYFGYFGYHGFGGRPYYSEEMFDDYEKPKEKDPPKEESPATETSANATIPETNATQPNSGGSPGGNDTSATGSSAPGRNPGGNPTAQSRVFPLPRVNASGPAAPRNQVPWRPSQPHIYKNYPNPNIRNLPAGKPWPPTTGPVTQPRPFGPFYPNPPTPRGAQWNSLAWEGKPGNPTARPASPTARPGNPTYRKPYPPTPRVSYPSYAGNPANFRRKPQGPNAASLGPKQGPAGRQEQMQNPKIKLPGQKITPAKATPAPWRNSQQRYGIDRPNYPVPGPEGHMLGPNFNSVNQRENSYYPRRDPKRIPSSNAQTQSHHLPKGIALEPRRIPSESETKQHESKQNTHQPVHPKETPPPTRGRFPAGRNTWNHQGSPPPFKEDPGRQEKHLPHPPHGSSRNVFYPNYGPYYPRENALDIGGNVWDERVDAPKTLRQPENSRYVMNALDQKDTLHYNEEDPIDPTGDESFTEQNKWGEDETDYKGGSTVRPFKGGRYASHQAKEYVPYSFGNPSKPREDFPYGEFYPWSPDETFPPYSPGPTLSPPVENGYYYLNNAIGQEERTLFPSLNSWDHKIQTREQKERDPYFNKIFWEQSTTLHAANLPDQNENYLYPRNSPVGLQKNPTWHEDENLNYDLQITRSNLPEREPLAFPDLIPQTYPSGQKGAHLFHQGQRGSCCIGGSIRPKDNPMALQDYTSSYTLALGENQDTNPMYTESSNAKYTRSVVSPTTILPDQRNNSEKELAGERQSPSLFRDDMSTVRRNTPCSVNNQLGQIGIVSFPDAGTLQSKNAPCLKNDLGGDRNNDLEQIFESNQPNKRTVALTPEQLVIGTPDKDPKPEVIRNEIEGKDNREQQRPPNILKVPCVGSKLTKLQDSTTAATPSSNRRQSSFGSDLSMPTESPNTLVGLATGEQFKNINGDQLDTDKHTLFESFQGGIDLEDQAEGCLLLQA
ncbi:enamelin [Perognathus longimembris pacificus]|uniref:enamelin n=1 Tax=Perognathus longimembris pacificus TaxID=214514 RepID=UPI002018D5EC|nr:enamelin [Perognathus longimembris pacificus]